MKVNFKNQGHVVKSGVRSPEAEVRSPKFKVAFAAFFFIANFSSVIAFAQTQFIRQDSIPVTIGNQQLQFAWAGGMNFVQFSDIDLNLDGIKDLFVFDRSGNKITTYLNLGTPNTVDYKYAPQYINKFPRMHDWVLLRDYNNDGLADIFTSNASQIQVFKNISTVANGVQFQLVTDSIVEDRAPNSTHTISPLNVSWIDIPAIRDVDGDGDWDILNYGVVGTQMEYHKNLSMETYGVPDSLLFRLESLCWGEYTESQFDATLTLNTPCNPPPMQAQQNSPYKLHGGSCMECINTDGDNDQDLLIGDLSN